MASGSNSAVEHSPHHPKVDGSSTAINTRMYTLVHLKPKHKFKLHLKKFYKIVPTMFLINTQFYEKKYVNKWWPVKEQLIFLYSVLPFHVYIWD